MDNPVVVQDLSVLRPFVDDTKIAVLGVEALVAQANNVVVDDQMTFDMANDLLGILKTTEKSLDAERDERYKTVKAMEGYVMGDVRALLKLVKESIDKVKAPMLGWTKEQQRLRDAEQARLDEAARKERERLEKQAATASARGHDEKAAVLAATAAVITAPIATSTYVAPKGLSTRKVWKGRVSNKEQLIADILANPSFLNLIEIPEAGLNRLAAATEGNIPLRGIETYQEETLAKRAA